MTSGPYSCLPAFLIHHNAVVSGKLLGSNNTFVVGWKEILWPSATGTNPCLPFSPHHMSVVPPDHAYARRLRSNHRMGTSMIGITAIQGQMLPRSCASCETGFDDTGGGVGLSGGASFRDSCGGKGGRESCLAGVLPEAPSSFPWFALSRAAI